MNRLLSCILLVCWVSIAGAIKLDWLRDDVVSATASLQPSDPLPDRIQNSSNLYVLGNGLLSRVFATTTDGAWATWDIITATDGSALRAMSPEATLTLDQTTYHIGGLVPITLDGAPCAAPSGVGPTGSCPVAYSNSSQRYAVNGSAFQYVNHSTSLPEAPFPWKPGSRHSRSTVNWPPKGLKLSVNFRAPATALPRHLETTVTVNYEMYDGHPIISKSVTVNAPPKKVVAVAEEVAAPNNILLPLSQLGNLTGCHSRVPSNAR